MSWYADGQGVDTEEELFYVSDIAEVITSVKYLGEQTKSWIEHTYFYNIGKRFQVESCGRVTFCQDSVTMDSKGRKYLQCILKAI